SRTFPEDARLARLLGHALADAAEDEEAIIAFERARTLDAEEHKQVAERLGGLYFADAKKHAAAGRGTRAIERAKAALDLVTDPSEPAIFVAGLLRAGGE